MQLAIFTHVYFSNMFSVGHTNSHMVCHARKPTMYSLVPCYGRTCCFYVSADFYKNRRDELQVLRICFQAQLYMLLKSQEKDIKAPKYN